MASSQYGKEARQERAQARAKGTQHTKTQVDIQLPVWANTPQAEGLIAKAKELRGNYKQLPWDEKRLVRQANLVVLSGRLAELEQQISVKEGVDVLGSQQLADNLLSEFFGPQACCSICGSRDHQLQLLSGNMIIRKLVNSDKEFTSGDSFFEKLGQITPLELRTGLIGQGCCAQEVLRVLEAVLPQDAHENDFKLHWPGTNGMVGEWAQKRAGMLFAQNRRELWRLQNDHKGLSRALNQANEDLLCLERERERAKQNVRSLASQLGFGDKTVAVQA